FYLTNNEPNQKPKTMNTTTAHPALAGSTIQRITIRRFIALTLLTLVAAATLPALHAQTAALVPDPSTLNSQPSTPSITAAFQPVIDGLAGKYGWFTTVLLAIGSLRVLFKPVMLVVENALKNDPAKYAAIQ